MMALGMHRHCGRLLEMYDTLNKSVSSPGECMNPSLSGQVNAVVLVILEGGCLLVHSSLNSPKSLQDAMLMEIRAVCLSIILRTSLRIFKE